MSLCSDELSRRQRQPEGVCDLCHMPPPNLCPKTLRNATPEGVYLDPVTTYCGRRWGECACACASALDSAAARGAAGAAGAARPGPAFVHFSCAVWCPTVIQERDEGRFIALRKGQNGSKKREKLEKVVERAKAQACALCGRTGATLRCADKRCPVRYHMGCAHEAALFSAPDDDGRPRWDVACPDHGASIIGGQEKDPAVKSAFLRFREAAAAIEGRRSPLDAGGPADGDFADAQVTRAAAAVPVPPAVPAAAAVSAALMRVPVQVPRPVGGRFRRTTVSMDVDGPDTPPDDPAAAQAGGVGVKTHQAPVRGPAVGRREPNQQGASRAAPSTSAAAGAAAAVGASAGSIAGISGGAWSWPVEEKKPKLQAIAVARPRATAPLQRAPAQGPRASFIPEGAEVITLDDDSDLEAAGEASGGCDTGEARWESEEEEDAASLADASAGCRGSFPGALATVSAQRQGARGPSAAPFGGFRGGKASWPLRPPPPPPAERERTAGIPSDAFAGAGLAGCSARQETQPRAAVGARGSAAAAAAAAANAARGASAEIRDFSVESSQELVVACSDLSKLWVRP